MDNTQNVQTKVKIGLKDATSSRARRRIAQFLGPAKVNAVKNFPLTGPLHRETKAQAIANLRARLDEANGCQVFCAATSAEAIAYARKVIKLGSIVVKSKSNAAKETGVIERLIKDGVTVVETDMGDRICQLGEIPASHPIGPALHVPVAKVAELFSKEAGHDVAADPTNIVSIARDLLRNSFFLAQYGISGANAIAADTGSIVLTENEGNIRIGTNLPPVHLVFAGIEKIVPTLEEAVHVCHTAALYGTGASVGGYINIVSGPGRSSPSLPFTHIAVASVQQIVPDLPEAMTVARFASLGRTDRKLVRYISIITGPSSTSDIEGKNVRGMHGPKEVFVILVQCEGDHF